MDDALSTSECAPRRRQPVTPAERGVLTATSQRAAEAFDRPPFASDARAS